MSLFSNENLADGVTVNGNKVPDVMLIDVAISSSSANANVFICPAVAYKVLSVREVHGVVGGTSAAVTLEIIPSGTANGSGTANVLSAPISLTATANTPQKGTLGTGVTLAPGTRLGTVFSGTLTGLANGFVQIAIARV